jgi:hypothetical protein
LIPPTSIVYDSTLKSKYPSAVKALWYFVFIEIAQPAREMSGILPSAFPAPEQIPY